MQVPLCSLVQLLQRVALFTNAGDSEQLYSVADWDVSLRKTLLNIRLISFIEF